MLANFMRVRADSDVKNNRNTSNPKQKSSKTDSEIKAKCLFMSCHSDPLIEKKESAQI